MSGIDAANQEVVDTVVRILRKCRSVMFVTGAGISADSGVPTYRGIGGLYEIEMTEEGLPIEEVLSGPMFRSRPELTWKYLAKIADAARGAAHNRAHEVIAEMERHFPRVWILTQNVDGFHRLAGSRNVIEIHGNMRSLSCTRCEFATALDEDSEIAIPPTCPTCGGVLRPDVVLFEEALPVEALTRLRRELETGFGLVFSIGTSSVFPYIQEPVVAARRLGVPTVEINPSTTVLSASVDYRIALGAADAMEAIWRGYTQNAV
jgi:NAD-dependent deacetylase